MRGEQAVSQTARDVWDRSNHPSWLWSGAPEEVGFSLFRALKSHQFLSTTHYSPVILTAKFSDFSFTLGVTI